MWKVRVLLGPQSRCMKASGFFVDFSCAAGFSAAIFQPYLSPFAGIGAAVYFPAKGGGNFKK